MRKHETLFLEMRDQPAQREKIGIGSEPGDDDCRLWFQVYKMF